MTQPNSSVDSANTFFRATPSILMCFGIGLLLCALLSGSLHFWDSQGILLWGALRHAILPCMACFAGALVLAKRFSAKPSLSLVGFALSLIVYTCSDAVTSPYSLFPGIAARADYIILAALAWYLISQKIPLLKVLALASPLLVGWCFLRTTAGALLFGDDNAAVIYRLMLLGKHFPTLSHYNTLWNAGIEARDYLGTGSLNIYFLSRPMTLFSSIENSYTYVIATVCFGLATFSSYRAALCIGLSNRAALVASLLALAPSMIWWVWCLKYGAMGFVCSAALLPWAFAAAFKLSDTNAKLSLLHAVFYALLITLYLFWPLAGLALTPLVLLALPTLPTLLRRKYFIIAVGLALLIFSIWAGIFWKISKVDSFVALNSDPKTSTKEWDHSLVHAGLNMTIEGALKRLRDAGTAANPLLLFFGLPGILLLLTKRAKIAYGSSVLILLFLGCGIAQIKPHFELERMLLLMLLILIVPTACALDRALGDKSDKHYSIKLALLSAALALGILSTCRVVSNRSIHRFALADDSVIQLAKAIQENASDGRTAFSGFVLHNLSGGHLAPLALLADRPLITSAYTHTRWRYTDLIPSSFFGSASTGFEQYFDLMNASLVAAHESSWRSYFKLHPDLYQELGHFGSFDLFKRLAWKPSYFIEGSGEIIAQRTDELQLKLNTSDAVIKFSYLPILQSSACKISARKVSPELEFISLSECPIGQIVSIKAKPIINRLFAARKS